MNKNDKKKAFILGVKIYSCFGCFSIFVLGTQWL